MQRKIKSTLHRYKGQLQQRYTDVLKSVGLLYCIRTELTRGNFGDEQLGDVKDLAKLDLNCPFMMSVHDEKATMKQPGHGILISVLEGGSEAYVNNRQDLSERNFRGSIGSSAMRKSASTHRISKWSIFRPRTPNLLEVLQQKAISNDKAIQSRMTIHYHRMVRVLQFHVLLRKANEPV